MIAGSPPICWRNARPKRSPPMLVQAHRAKMPAPEELIERTPQAPTGSAAGHRPGFDDIVWFRMNIGRRQNADPRWLLPLICKRGHITKAEVGAIRIGAGETRFQVPRAIAKRFDQAVQGVGERQRRGRKRCADRGRRRPASADGTRTLPRRGNIRHVRRLARREGRRQARHKARRNAASDARHGSAHPRRCRRLPGEGRGLQGGVAAGGAGRHRQQFADADSRASVDNSRQVVSDAFDAADDWIADRNQTGRSGDYRRHPPCRSLSEGGRGGTCRQRAASSPQPRSARQSQRARSWPIFARAATRSAARRRSRRRIARGSCGALDAVLARR